MYMAKIRAGNGLDMGNSFELYLDTTGPIIEVIAPNYAMKNSMVDYEVKANERLAIDQDFYFIDSSGQRHDMIFEYNGDSFLGWVDFSRFKDGIAVFYAQVKDEVMNSSAEVKHSILVHAGIGVDVEILDIGRDMEQKDSSLEIYALDGSRPIYEIKLDRVIDVNERARYIGVKESE